MHVLVKAFDQQFNGKVLGRGKGEKKGRRVPWQLIVNGGEGEKGLHLDSIKHKKITVIFQNPQPFYPLHLIK